MIFLVVALSFIGCVALLTGGYLFGAKKGQGVRAELEGELDKLSSELKALHSETRKDLHRVLEAVQAHEKLEELLEPIAVREKLGLELSRVEYSLQNSLNTLFEETAKIPGLERLVLSDESGLLLTASGGHSSKLEALAGSSSLLFVLSDRFKRVGIPSPNAFVAHDDKNATLYRIFSVDGARYMLSVISSNPNMSPSMFDGIVHKLQSLLSKTESPFIKAISQQHISNAHC